MKKTMIKFLITILGSYFIVAVSLANEVKVFTEDNVPSAEEMADILLNSPPKNNLIKTRSISFGKSKKNEPVKVGLPIIFAYNSSILSSKSETYLNQVGAMLNLEKMANEKIMIVGHTDTSGPESYNLNLSQKRSQAVKEFLISNYHVKPSRIETTGKGESDILPGKSGGASINRRVEFYRIQ